MIIFYLVDSKQIINSFPGFDEVSTVSDKVYVNGCLLLNTTTNTAWKYISEQLLERDSNGGYLQNADYYDAVTLDPTPDERVAALEQYVMEKELGLI
jgi:hypothetical protein